MGKIAEVLATINRSGFSMIGHFTLPDEAWWDDFYMPMEFVDSICKSFSLVSSAYL